MRSVFRLSKSFDYCELARFILPTTLFLNFDLAILWITILKHLRTDTIYFWISTILHIIFDLASIWITKLKLNQTDSYLKSWTLAVCGKMHDKICCVPNCKKTRKADNVTLHLFPNPDKDLSMFMTWINAIGGDIVTKKPQLVYKKGRVCNHHFDSRSYSCSMRLCRHAVPTLNLQELNKTTLLKENLNIVREKIRKLQRARSKNMINLKQALTISKNKTFIKVMQKLPGVANSFINLQLREVAKKKLGRRFTNDEKIMALALYKQGPKAYRWMQKFFVLPSPLTLSRLITNASLKPGINKNLFKELEYKASKMNLREKLCILLFNEISLTPHFDYNRRMDKISGFANSGSTLKIADHALVFMLRGLYRNYKQPISFSFCSGTTATLDLVCQIKTVITEIQKIGLHVIATVCDQGVTNVSAINCLIKTTREEYIKNNKELRHDVFEINGSEIIHLYDPPHLIKGIRNNLLNKNLTFKINGEDRTAKWEHIIMLYNEDPAYQGIRLMPKLTERHIIPKKIWKMKVKCATQVFSQAVAANMGYLANKNILPAECKETADLLLFFDRLFDSYNGSYTQSRKKCAKHLLQAVTPNSQHHKVWAEAIVVLKTMKFVHKNKLSSVPSISNWIKTITNTIYMIEQLFKKYCLKSVWMRHFNQDPLENFFGCIRSHGYRNTSPNCTNFETAFAALLINNLSNVQSKGSNCEKDSCHIFKSLKKIFFTKNIAAENITEIDSNDLYQNFNDFETKMSHPKIRAQLEYVTGYVLQKLKKKVFKNCNICKENLYATDEDAGGYFIKYKEYFSGKTCLTYPSLKLMQLFSKIQDIILNILKTQPDRQLIRQYAKTICSVTVNYNAIICKNHRELIISEMEDMCLNLFLYTWCKNTNKLLIGSRGDFDSNDKVQVMAVDYYKKHMK